MKASEGRWCQLPTMAFFTSPCDGLNRKNVFFNSHAEKRRKERRKQKSRSRPKGRRRKQMRKEQIPPSSDNSRPLKMFKLKVFTHTWQKGHQPNFGRIVCFFYHISASSCLVTLVKPYVALQQWSSDVLQTFTAAGRSQRHTNVSYMSSIHRTMGVTCHTC